MKLLDLFGRLRHPDRPPEPATRYCAKCDAAEWCHAPGGSRYGSCVFTAVAIDCAIVGCRWGDRNSAACRRESCERVGF